MKVDFCSVEIQNIYMLESTKINYRKKKSQILFEADHFFIFIQSIFKWKVVTAGIIKCTVKRKSQ